MNSIQALTPNAKSMLCSIMDDGCIQIEGKDMSECVNNYATIIALLEPISSFSLKSSFFSSIKYKFDLVLDLSKASEGNYSSTKVVQKLRLF